MNSLASTSPRLPDLTRSAKIAVLVAEESIGFGQGIAAWLLGDDITVVGQAPHYHKVTELAAELRPDVVVITFSMALKNGLEAIRRTLGQLCGARVLVLTPHTDNAFGEYIAAAGAAGYLNEQACSELLVSAVREVHEKNEFFPRDFVRSAHGEFTSRSGQVESEKSTTELTVREREVLQYIAEGNANKQTAWKLGISIKTVEKHRQSLMDKLCIHETATLTRYALYAGIAR